MRSAALALAALAVAPVPAAADSAEIRAGLGTRYLTPEVEIDQGGTAAFANGDVSSHDVTARDETAGEPLFASPLVASGGRATVAGVQYLRTGSYAFFCSVHPRMAGTLRVTAAGTPAPQPGGGGPSGTSGRDVTPPRLAISRPRRLRVVVTSDEAAAVSVVARRRGRRMAAGRATLAGAGRAIVRLRPPRRGKRALRGGRRVRVKLTVTARDPAGNRARLTRRAVLRR